MCDGGDFLGLDATAWAAVAAIGALLAALASTVTSLLTHHATGARPRVTVRIASLTDGVLQQRAVWTKEPGHWDQGGLQGVLVQIENGGRTALTAHAPVFELRDAWTSRRRWHRRLRRQLHTIGTQTLPFRGLTTADRVRVEPHDSVTYFVELAPLFGRPGEDGFQPRDWHHARVRVPIAGRRDVVPRRSPIAASPDKSQLSGKPIDMRTLLSRYFLRLAIMQERGDKGGDSWLPPSMAQVLVWTLEDAKKRDGKFTMENIQHSFEECNLQAPWNAALEVAFVLRDAGFMDDEDVGKRSAV